MRQPRQNSLASYQKNQDRTTVEHGWKCIKGGATAAIHTQRLGYEAATEGYFGKPKAKKFNYSSEMNSIVLERSLGDIAAIEGSTVSAVIEGIIIDRVLPADVSARHYVVKVLFGAKSGYGIRNALADINAVNQ